MVTVNVGQVNLDAVVVVVPHAISRARERWRLEGTDADVAAAIETNLRAWVARGQVFDRKPRSFRPYGDDGYLPPWQRLAGDSEKACVVAFDHVGEATVVTALSRAAKVPGAQIRTRRAR